MNVLHLKYASEIAKTGSLNKAAANLYVGQPNLSRAIKELEASLGIVIFDRTSRGMVLTPEGEVFLERAEKILKQIDEMESLYKDNAGIKQRFSVCAPRSAYVAEAFARFTASLREPLTSNLYYREACAADAIRYILESDCKLGVIRYEDSVDKTIKEHLEDKGIFWETVTDFSCIVTVGKHHPLAENKSVSTDMLKDYAEILFGSTQSSLTPPLSDISAPQRRIYVYERASMTELLNETDAFTWSEPMTKNRLESLGLVQICCPEAKKRYRDLLVYRADYRLTSVDKGFITELCLAKRSCM